MTKQLQIGKIVKFVIVLSNLIETVITLPLMHKCGSAINCTWCQLYNE